MKKWIAVAFLFLLAACQSAPKLEDDARYVRLGRVVDVHVFTDSERQQAKAQRPSAPRVSVGMGMGMGTGGSFGGMMIGVDTLLGGGRSDSDEQPQVDHGANRFTVETEDKAERIEVMSYGKYKVGDCVKVMAGHPTEYTRLFDLKPGEHCN